MRVPLHRYLSMIAVAVLSLFFIPTLPSVAFSRLSLSIEPIAWDANGDPELAKTVSVGSQPGWTTKLKVCTDADSSRCDVVASFTGGSYSRHQLALNVNSYLGKNFPRFEVGEYFYLYAVSRKGSTEIESDFEIIKGSASAVRGLPFVGASLSLWDTDLQETGLFSWYSCTSKKALPSNSKPSDCKRIPWSSSRTLEIDDSLEGRYLVVRHSNTKNYFSRSSKIITKPKPNISIDFWDSDDEVIDSVPVGKSAYVTVNFGDWTWTELSFGSESGRTLSVSPPRKIKVSFKDKAFGSTVYKLIDTDGEIKLKTKVKSNQLVTVYSPASSGTSATTKTAVIKGDPYLRAQAPTRAFGKYNLRLSSPSSVTTSCNVREDYYSFGGSLIGTRWFKMRISNGQGVTTRKTKYVGVLEGMVTCYSSSNWGNPIDTYKVFSY